MSLLNSSSPCSAIRVRLQCNHGSGFGLTPGKRSDSTPCLMVSSLQTGGEAASSGLLRPGDLILKINDKDVSRCSYDDAMQTFEASSADSELRLLIRAPPGYATHLETTFDAEGCPRTYRVTERLYTVGPNSSPAIRTSSGSINLNLDDGKDTTDTRRR